MPTLSIIIPTWQEAPQIRDAVQCAQRIGDEVIVVDGGSSDETTALAEAAGARVVLAPKGRGRQLQAGANAGTGDILLFLHADVRLPPAARDAILRALSDPTFIGGNFLIRFLPASWFTHLLAWANDIRRRLTRRYYGDSGIFVRRAAYFELDGFRDFPLMEDYDFSARMERHGRCAYIRQVSAYASARRFQGREIRVLLLWMLLQTLYWLGLPPHLIARAYPDVRGNHPETFMRACQRQFAQDIGAPPE